MSPVLLYKHVSLVCTVITQFVTKINAALHSVSVTIIPYQKGKPENIIFDVFYMFNAIVCYRCVNQRGGVINYKGGGKFPSLSPPPVLCSDMEGQATVGYFNA